MRAARCAARRWPAWCWRCAVTLILFFLIPPPGWGAPFTAAAQLAERALLVLTPDPVALRDGRIVADALIAGHHTQKSVRLIVNRVTRQSFGKNAPVFDLDECIDTVGVQLIGVIPESRALQLAGAHGAALAQGCAAQTAGAAIAGRVLGERIPLTFTGW